MLYSTEGRDTHDKGECKAALSQAEEFEQFEKLNLH